MAQDYDAYMDNDERDEDMGTPREDRELEEDRDL